MQLKDSEIGSHKKVAQAPRESLVFSPPIFVWLMHWISALLVLFLLATSLASGLGLTMRLFPGAWMDLHLSAGIALLVVTVVRMWFSLPWKYAGRISVFSNPYAQTLKWALLLVVFAVGLTGLAIFQKPPFGRSGILFWLFPMPTLIRLDHSIHNVIIYIHIVLSCIVAVLLMSHIIAGLQRFPVSRQTRLAVMLWPWRKGQRL